VQLRIVLRGSDNPRRLAGATRYRDLHLNTGHGTLGWTMACGSGSGLADLLSGRRPEIDTSELALGRYEHRFG
jgi:D-amino-acid dehydrogenase